MLLAAYRDGSFHAQGTCKATFLPRSYDHPGDGRNGGKRSPGTGGAFCCRGEQCRKNDQQGVVEDYSVPEPRDSCGAFTAISYQYDLDEASSSWRKLSIAASRVKLAQSLGGDTVSLAGPGAAATAEEVAFPTGDDCERWCPSSSPPREIERYCEKAHTVHLQHTTTQAAVAGPLGEVVMQFIEGRCASSVPSPDR